MARAARPGSIAYVLHSHDWSESSLILDLFTREHGRVVAVAKGAKRPYSQLRPVLMPFQRLVVGFGVKKSDEVDVWLLRQAEWAGGPAWPGGAALLPGFYLNELLMRLMVRHDPHPDLFDAYAHALQAMADASLLPAALRAFELILLRQMGHLPDLSIETVSGQAVQAQLQYELHPDLGVVRGAPRAAEAGAGPVLLGGATLQAMEANLLARVMPSAQGDARSALPSLMGVCMPVLSELKSLLRTHIHYHLGSQPLRTRQLMMELPQT